MIIGRGNLKYSPWQRLVWVPLLSTTNTTWNILGLKTGLCGEKTATVLSCDDPLYIVMTHCTFITYFFRYLLLKILNFFSVRMCDMVLNKMSGRYEYIEWQIWLYWVADMNILSGRYEYIEWQIWIYWVADMNILSGRYEYIEWQIWIYWVADMNILSGRYEYIEWQIWISVFCQNILM